MRCAALIVAGGHGERLGGALPKQYRPLAGRPVLGHAIGAFLAHPDVHGVRVVIDPGHRAHYERATAGLGLEEPVGGGRTRQDSVRLGLESLAAATSPPDLVLIHDGARPLVGRALIDRVIGALHHAEAVLPAVPVVDSLRRLVDGRLVGEIDRVGIARAQTPQGFAFRPILEAHRLFQDQAFTDDAAMARAAGLEVVAVEGEEANLKITLPEDLETAARHLERSRRIRVGTGFDVHAFAQGRRLILGGIEIPFDRGLAGHSDADVLLHALTDALLGTIGAGDIGVHFPPGDSRWKDVDSGVFLQHAARLVGEAGGAIEHVDVTLICERPKLGPYRQTMRARIAGLLGIAAENVSLKATTTEGLGFTGRGEGIAAQAVATVSLSG
jgi:2-C-methyl-D-erythritol 4-phosphate cytidylyltransferase/2-C-methyl-D-erythritol 2,4-cyclodiphosphate synthase